MIHYGAINQKNNTLNKYKGEGNIEFLKQKSSFKMFGEENLKGIKSKLIDYNIDLRINI
tara:strand:+ start:472 stop:648 length:177 start_codon:yes stop_codon:yes gene_type:complete